jgi:hypothetical protein
MSGLFGSGYFGATTGAGQPPAPGRPSRAELAAAARGGLVGWVRDRAGGWLGRLRSQGTPQQQALEKEEAAGGPRGIIFPAFLPYIDDKTGETPAMRLAYRRMFADVNVKAALCPKIFGVAALDLRLLPSGKRRARAHEVADFVQWNLTRRLKYGWVGLAWELLVHGCMDGYTILEKLVALERRHPRYTGRYVFRDLKPKVTGDDVILQVDEFREPVAVMGLRYNPAREFSPAKFVIWQHLPLFRSPGGMSDFRAPYSRWWLLDTVTKLRGMAAEKRYGPVIAGKYKDTAVKPSLEAALAQLKSSNYLVMPDEVELQVLDIAGRSDEFFSNFVRDLKHDIFLGIQFAMLQSIEGSVSDGRGNSEVHKDTADIGRWFLSTQLCQVLNDPEAGVIQDLVDLNYVGEEAPLAMLGGVDDAELKESVSVDRDLHDMGLPLSKDDLYERSGRKPPDTPEDTLPGGSTPGPDGGGGNGGGAGPDGAPSFDEDDGPELTEFCGGAGSGVPGPCPSGDSGGGAAVQEKEPKGDAVHEHITALSQQAKERVHHMAREALKTPGGHARHIAARVGQAVATKARELHADLPVHAANAVATTAHDFVVGQALADHGFSGAGVALKVASFGLAKGYLAARKAVRGHGEFAEPDLAGLVRHTRELLEAVRDAAGVEMPLPSDEAIAAALRQKLGKGAPSGVGTFHDGQPYETGWGRRLGRRPE